MKFYLCCHNSCEIWHSFSRTTVRNFLWCYYRWVIHLKPLKNVKKNAIFFKLFWQMDFVYWKLKLINFVVDSVLSLMLSGKKDIYQSITKSFQKSHFIRAPVPYHKKAVNGAINYLGGGGGGRRWGIMTQSITVLPPTPGICQPFVTLSVQVVGNLSETLCPGMGHFSISLETALFLFQ